MELLTLPNGNVKDLAGFNFFGVLMDDQKILAHKILVSNILKDPSVSFWLKNAIQTSIERDPVDALKDAEFLVGFLLFRLESVIDEN